MEKASSIGKMVIGRKGNSMMIKQMGKLSSSVQMEELNNANTRMEHEWIGDD